MQRIDKVDEFDQLYQLLRDKCNNNPLQVFYRGMPEAKYKLVNSAQRTWITMKIREWNISENYRSFFYKLLEAAKKDFLLKRVMDFYGATEQFDFSLLSLIQHYGGPTPLLDWTYDLNIALYFATEHQNGSNFFTEAGISDYFSLYVINNTFLQLQSLAKAGSFKEVFESVRDPVKGADRIFYLSDFTEKRGGQPPLTSVFNQNIIPQKGLFIFNPSRTVPLETYLLEANNKIQNVQAFTCYNIHKGLAEYIRRKIASQGYTKDFVYPTLTNNIYSIKEAVLNSYFIHK